MNELVEKDGPAEPLLDMDAEFKTWKSNPTPDANAHMLKLLGPTIDKAAGSQVGGTQNVNPLVRAKARTIALGALHSYDPERGRLHSHIYNHMQGLKRYVGQIASGIKVPERLILDRRAVDAATTELTDELGREPSDDELGDRTGFHPRRLAKLRSFHAAVSEGHMHTVGENGPEGEPYDPAVQSRGGPNNAWLQVVHDDLPPLDQKVFEWTLGWNGNKTLQNQDIARRLRRSPGWVSQRKLLIQRMLDQEQSLSPFGA